MSDEKENTEQAPKVAATQPGATKGASTQPVVTKAIEQLVREERLPPSEVEALRLRHRWPEGHRLAKASLTEALEDWKRGPLTARGTGPRRA